MSRESNRKIKWDDKLKEGVENQKRFNRNEMPDFIFTVLSLLDSHLRMG